MIYTQEIHTPIGTMTLTSGDSRLLEKYKKNIEKYFTKKKFTVDFTDFTITGTPFQKQVLQVLCNVPYGQTVSYGELARMAGYPNAIRAVASVVAQNKHYILIPCHRVIRSDGTIGKYGAGSDRKRWLLRHEGIMV